LGLRGRKRRARIAKTQKLPTLKTVAQMSLKDRQKLYRDTRTNIMRGNLDPFGEKSLLENAGTQQDIERRRKEQATTQDTTQASSSTLLAGSPTDSEVSQSDTTNATGTELTARRVKKRGRKINIYTSSSGKTSDKLILGKKSLLGRV
jgi:primase-polymerase (primpol)-like protein